MLACPLLSLCASIPPALPEADLSMEPVAWTAPDGREVALERGVLLAPLVRSDPGGKAVEVEVYRFPAEPDAPGGVPPIFQLHGGPGWPGIRLERLDYANDVEPFTRYADLVVVGQRGIGSSTNTPCGVAEFPAGSTRAEREARFRSACSACREHWEAQGYDLSGFNVIEAAEDVDDVRRLLGYDRITLWGTSFGSHWAMAVMRYFPDGVARAVLSGLEGPDHTYDSPAGLLAALERIAASATDASELRGELPADGLVAALAEVVARLEDEPVEVEVEHPATGAPTTVRFEADDVREIAFGYTGSVRSRRRVVSWPADVIALHRGEFEHAARARLADGERRTENLPTASFFMLDCGSGITAERHERYRNDPATAILGDPNRMYDVACPAWNSDLGDGFRTGFRTAIPTVLVHGNWDVSTPFENALELAPAFERGHFVVVERGTHGALREALEFSPEFARGLGRFVVEGSTADLPAELVLPPIDFTAPHGSR